MQSKVIKDRYQIMTRIGKGGWSEVFQGVDLKSNESIVVKVHDTGLDLLHTDELLRFQREAITLLELHHNSIVRVLDYGEAAGTYYLVMENDNGHSLLHHLHTQNWPQTNESIHLMIQLADALSYVHKKNIIHQDLKPSNVILADGQLDRCKIVDFGCVLLKHALCASDQRMVMGTFPYISPEQLGAHEGQIDARSDLYALGVLFYELLSGKRPYGPATTPMEVQEGRDLKIEPPSKINKLIPEILDRITMKLIAYDPDQRYQTAAGLLEDLRQYKAKASKATVAPFFRLAKKDDDLSFNIPVIGRKNEITTLQYQHRQARQGNGSFILLGGEAGFGKSRLLEELRGYAISTDSLFLFGKCNITEANYPYFPLIQALQEYMERLMDMPQPEASPHFQAIKFHLSMFYSEVSDISPAMVKYLDPGKDIGIDNPTSRLSKFIRAICDFFITVAGYSNSMVLVFEDIHWADQATFQFFNSLIPSLSQNARLMVVASYRTEEVEECPQLREFLSKVDTNHQNTVELFVSPLTPSDVWDFVGSLLSEETEGFRSLLQFLFEFSRGNPLFILEMMRSLIEEKVIQKGKDGWEILQQAEIAKPIVGMSLAEIILRRARHLTPRCNEILTIASCIGRSFLPRHLEAILAESANDIEPFLDEALRSRLIVRDPGGRTQEFHFTHDKIYETFYGEVSEDRRKQLHQQIGEILEKETEDELGKNVYALAYHFRRGHSTDKAFKYALEAGYLAEKSLATHQAAQFFEQALKQFDSGTGDQSRALEIKEKLADACTIIGDYEKAMANYRAVLAAATSSTDRAMMERKMGWVQFKKGQMPKAMDHFLSGLELLGGHLSRDHRKNVFFAAIFFFGDNILRFIPRKIRQLRFRNRHEELRELTSLFLLTTFPLFWVDYYHSMECQAKVRFYGRLLGPSPEYVMSMNNDAVGCASLPVFNTSLGMAILKKSRKMADKIDNLPAKAHTHYLSGLVFQWAGKNREAIKQFEKAAEINERIGDLFQLEINYTSLAQSLRHLGYLDHACDYIMRSLDIAESVKDYRGIADSYYQLAEYFYHSGNFGEAYQNLRLCYQYITKDSNPLLFAITNRVEASLLLKQGQIEKAIELLESSMRIVLKRNFVREYFLPTTLTLTEAYILALETRPKANQKLRKYWLSQASKYLRYNFRQSKKYRNYPGHCLRLRARLHEVRKQGKEADRCYRKALRALQQTEHQYELAVAKMNYAEFLENFGTGQGESMKKQALALFKKCNAKWHPAIITNEEKSLESLQAAGSGKTMKLERPKTSS